MTLAKILDLFISISGSYGIALIMLSFFIWSVSYPLLKLASIVEKAEKKIQNIIRPKLNSIKESLMSQQDKHERVELLYNSYNYSPLYSIRSFSVVLIQIPFFVLAYKTIISYSALSGNSFLFIRDLGSPDALLYGTNLLPLLMTFINFISIKFSDMDDKLKFNAGVIALFFLILLYNKPSSLLLYWTTNNFISMLVNLRLWQKSNEIYMRDIYNVIPLFSLVLAAIVMFIVSSRFPEKYNYAPKPFYTLFIISSVISIVCCKRNIKYLPLIPLVVSILYMAIGYNHLLFKSNFFMLTLAYILLFANIYNNQFYFKYKQQILMFSFVVLVYTTIRNTSIGGLIVNNNNLKAQYEIYLLISFILFLQIFNFLKQEKNKKWLIKGIILSLYFIIFAYLSIIRFETEIFTKTFIKIIFGYIFIILIGLLTRSQTEKRADNFDKKMLFMVTLFFALNYINSNLEYFNIKAIPVFIITLLLLSFTFYLFFFSTFQNAGRLLISFVLSLFLLPIFKELSQYNESSLEFYIIFFIIFYLIILLSNYTKYVLIFLFIGVASFIINISFHINELDSYKGEDKDLSILVPDDFKERKIIRTPNVYIFSYDGIPPTIVFNALGIDNNKFLSALEDNGYTNIENSYSSGGATYKSMSSLYNIVNTDQISDDEKKKIISGYSLVNAVFKYNGYTTYTIYDPDMTKGYNYVDHSLPVNKLILPDWLTLPMDVLQGIGQGTLNTMKVKFAFGHKLDDMVNAKLDVIRDETPMKFVMSHVNLPSHSAMLGFCTNDQEIWEQKYELAVAQIIDDIRNINELDPDAIVVFMSDHGPMLLNDCSTHLANEKIDKAYIYNMYGTILAMRFPGDQTVVRYSPYLVKIQDIFPVIFSYLYDDDYFLKYKYDDSVILDNHIFINKDGLYIPYGGK